MDTRQFQAFLLHQLKNYGVEDTIPIWSHYYRVTCKGQKELAATSCVLISKADFHPISKGMAVVSSRDNGDKVIGRWLSLQRACEGMLEKKDSQEKIRTKQTILGFEALPKRHGSFSFKKSIYLKNELNWPTFLSEQEFKNVTKKQRTKQLVA